MGDRPLCRILRRFTPWDDRERRERATNGRPYGGNENVFFPIVILNGVKDPAKRVHPAAQDPSSFLSSG